MLALSHQFEIGIATMFVAAASYSLAAEPDITVPPETRPFMLAMPRPTHPEEARAQHITGRGVYDAFVDPPTGVVARVTVAQSTGSKILDGAAVNAFRWRARPGKLSRLRVPCTFTLRR